MDAIEITMRVRRADGHWSARPIWVVTIEGEAYVRSAFGERSTWYRQIRKNPVTEVEVGDITLPVRLDPVDDEDLIARVSAAYRAKYGPSWPGPVETMTGPDAATTTMRLTDLREAT